jgi:hypothetical protein
MLQGDTIMLQGDTIGIQKLPASEMKKAVDTIL